MISPILANIDLHYVLDLWFKSQRTSRKIGGESYIVRYADDFGVCFQYKAEAERFLHVLRERLEKFGLTLHPSKTRLIEFGRYADVESAEKDVRRPLIFGGLRITAVKLVREDLGLGANQSRNAWHAF